MTDDWARPPLRVAMPMLTLVPGGMGGMETYARELVAALSVDDRVEPRCLTSSAAAEEFGAAGRVITRRTPAPTTMGRLTTLSRAATNLHARRLLPLADIVHYPFTVPVPTAPRGLPTVVTLADPQHLDLPELFSPAERLYRLPTYDRPVRRAAQVITFSDFAKRRILHHHGIPADRVTVAHLAVDTTYFTPVRAERENFVLYPARGWSHKNHALLIEAMSLLRRDRPELRLVLTGGGLESLGILPTWVDVRGLVPLMELRDLYRRAACVAFPSRYEGFGLPPLEALACGCPIAVATAGSLPEICGPAAHYFSPDDAGEAARAIVAAIDSAGQQQIDKGQQQCAQFTWTGCADAHVSAYYRAARLAPA